MDALDRHKMLPFFARKTGALPADARPPDFAAVAMRKSYLRAAMLSLYRDQSIKEIVPALEGAGLDVLVLKGAAMAHFAYPDPAMRLGSDIDLLVSPDHVRKAGDVLESLGYRCRKKRFDISQNRNHEEEYFYGDNSLKRPIIEIHWNLFPYFMFNQQADVKPVFERAITVDMKGCPFRAMHPADALCHEATHMIYGHNREIRLNWILDVGLLGRMLSTQGHWGLVQQLSVDSLSRIAIEESIGLARAWTGLQLPGEFADFAGWPCPSRREIHFHSYYFTHNPYNGAMLALSGGGRRRDTLAGLGRHAFPPPQVIRETFPDLERWPLPLLYLRRWVKLLANR